MCNRRGANWTIESAPWAAGVARRKVTEQLTEWGYRPDAEAIESVTGLLVNAAVADGGRRVSVHVSDQDQQACILALSHHTPAAAGHEPGGDDILHQVTAVSAVTGCGTETGADGRRIWAVISL
ncbi:hypothetical protein [Streptomyces sp. NPDC019224]|uniref:hypothetical protein n=1 Tax=Streptomyces sp. NPDC019224 TaxID=3154484 RepID=UPI0033FA1D8D